MIPARLGIPDHQAPPGQVDPSGPSDRQGRKEGQELREPQVPLAHPVPWTTWAITLPHRIFNWIHATFQTTVAAKVFLSMMTAGLELLGGPVLLFE